MKDKTKVKNEMLTARITKQTKEIFTKKNKDRNILNSRALEILVLMYITGEITITTNHEVKY